MLQLLNFSRTKISMLTNLKDYHIVETLDGNETLYFSLPIEDSQNMNIKLEYYVQNEKNRYVIKEKHSSGDWYDYVCQLDLDDFRNGQSGPNGTITLSTILSAVCSSAEKAWTYTCPSTTAKYINTQGLSLLDCIKLGISEFGMEFKFDSINRIITVKKIIGEDKGCYFIEELNLKKLDIDSDTNNLITRLEPTGKDLLDIWSINNHKYYVENYSYTNKVIHAFWLDERYTDSESLKTAAEYKLAELCRPATTYSVDIVDLASASMEYADILSYELGDTVTLFNRKENQKQTHRIVEIDSYPEEPHRNTCQLSSRAYSIIGVQKQAFKSTDSLKGKVGITKANGDGTVSTAKAGTDYQTPITAGTDYVAPSYFTASQQPVTWNTSAFSSQGWWGYSKKRGNMCTVSLAFKCTSAQSHGTTICTLPSGYYSYSAIIQNVMDSTSVKVSIEGSTVKVNGSMPAGSYQVCITYICSD